jgi:hypothetical protein
MLTSPPCDTRLDANKSVRVRLCGVVLSPFLSKVAEAVHVVEAIGQDTRKRRRHGTYEVEYSIALL